MLAAIHDLGLEWHVIFNKGSVMALPSGVNKATGLAPALAELGVTAADTSASATPRTTTRSCGCAGWRWR